MLFFKLILLTITSFRDPESSLYYYRARYYDPGLGRFLQADPVGYEAGSLNLYIYCGNNPLNTRDPSGKCDEQTFQRFLNNLLDALANRDFEKAATVIQKFLGPICRIDSLILGASTAPRTLEAAQNYKMFGALTTILSYAKPMALLLEGK